MVKSVSLALVGAGKWGQNYISTINCLDKVELAFVVSKRKEVLSLVGPLCRVVSSIHEIDTNSIDGIIIATPADTHLSIATDFVNAGVPVLIEKPVALQLKEAVEFAKVAEQKNVHVRVAHIHLYNSAFRSLKDSIGIVKKNFLIRTSAGNRGPFRKDVGVLFDWGSHDVAMIVDLIGCPPSKITAFRKETRTLEGFDGEFVKLKFFWSGLGVAEVNLSNTLSGKQRLFEITIGKEKLVFNDFSEHKLVRFAADNSSGQPINVESIAPLSQLVLEFAATIRKLGNGREDLSLSLSVLDILEKCQLNIES